MPEPTFAVKNLGSFYMGQTYMKVRAESYNDAMKSIQKTLRGSTIKPEKAAIRFKEEHPDYNRCDPVEIKVVGFKKNDDNDHYYIEFNRLSGCAFLFQKKFIECKLNACEYTDIPREQIENELELINTKVNFWYSSSVPIDWNSMLQHSMIRN